MKWGIGWIKGDSMAWVVSIGRNGWQEESFRRFAVKRLKQTNYKRISEDNYLRFSPFCNLPKTFSVFVQLSLSLFLSHSSQMFSVRDFLSFFIIVTSIYVFLWIVREVKCAPNRTEETTPLGGQDGGETRCEQKYKGKVTEVYWNN